MDEKRIIACLDIKDGMVVKGVNFVNLKEVGDPLDLGSAYDQGGADELAMLDITATVEGRRTFASLVTSMRQVVTIPITVGGGIRSLDDAKRLFDSGADKVSVASQAILTPSLIDDLARTFSSAQIVCAIDVKRSPDNGYQVVSRGGRSETDWECVAWAREVAARGAGEILLTSMDCDGAKEGFDIELYRTVTSAVTIPVTASGGAGTMAHFAEVFTQGGVSAALGASIFHFHEVEIATLKIFLTQCGIPMRNRT
ncbi:MAG: imidazole glycerol phosphate synthase subunit HisF [Sphaerochaeta sp.]|jgi:cyclase|nr:imidazole glycerol phosphate synthase subunit HisF [Sphaerochaeta sp.]MDX9914696.1 imidazole glycerol phosphate synthase subunit HisF [Sphaerochaeta sp.]